MVNPFAGDKEKLKNMKFRQKVDYIWTYYKFWFLVIALIVIIVGSFIQAQLAYNPDAMTMVTCDVYYEDSEATFAKLNEQFSQYIGLDEGDKEPITFDNSISFSQDTDSQTASVMIQKFMALIMSGGADLIITTQEGIDYYAGQSVFANLEEVLPESLFNYLKEQDLLFTTTIVPTEDEAADGAVEETIYSGIHIDQCPLVLENNMYLENISAGIVISGKHQALAIEFLQMMFPEAGN